MKFYATLGPACAQPETLCALREAGLTGVRVNLSHTTPAQLRQWLGKLLPTAGTGLDILLDVRGAEVRLGTLAAPVPLAEGELVWLGEGGLPLPAAAVAALQPGQVLLLDDGALALEVTRTEGLRAACRVTRGGLLRAHKSVALADGALPLPSLAEADMADLAIGAELGASEVMLPFVRDAAALRHARAALRRLGWGQARLLAKVEDRPGLAALADWLPEADEVVIARGDLGMHLPLPELPGAQQDIARVCRAAGKPFMVVTQLLHSMHNAPVPTRAEVNDIAHAVWDGAASLMLTGETAAGQYPIEALRTLVEVAGAAERYRQK